MTSDERKALSFVGVLLCLAAGARFVTRPDPVVIEAGGVNLSEYRRAGQSLAQQQAATARKNTKKTTRKTPVRVKAKREGPPADNRPDSSTVPRWRRAQPPPVMIVESEEKEPQARTGLLDLNRASAKELEALPGIGAVTARRIIALRDSLGRFQALEDIDAVRGIGKALLEKLRPHVVVR